MRAINTIGTIGAASFFHPDTSARGKEAGLDGFRCYVLGRGGVLGNVESEVVHGAFVYFPPDLIAEMWTTVSERVAPRGAARMHHRCARGSDAPGDGAPRAPREHASACARRPGPRPCNGPRHQAAG